MIRNEAQSSDKTWFTRQSRINGKKVYKDLSSEIIYKLDQGFKITDVINWIKEEVRKEYKNKNSIALTDGALNNCIGAWNEYIAASYLTHFSLEHNESNESKIAIITALPSTSIKNGSIFMKLFQEDEFHEGQSLHILKDIRDRIFFPSPDLIVLNLTNDFYIKNGINTILKQQEKEPHLSDLYKKLKGKIKTSNVLSISSLKTSYRPDRRYQPLFETAMLKAISYGLKRHWKYYMIASQVTPADEKLFNTIISPHSIALMYMGINSTQSNFVDDTFLYEDKDTLRKIFIKLTEIY